MDKRKRIGILTGGGDCPGLNCVIRAVISHATLTYNWEVLGIPYATHARRGLHSRPPAEALGVLLTTSLVVLPVFTEESPVEPVRLGNDEQYQS